MRFDRKRFQAEAKAAGLEATHKGNGHWQLTGGALLVNFYPYAKRGSKIYIQGTNEGRHGTAEEAIAAANKRPDVCPRADRDKRRRFGYRAKRRWMLRKSNNCHWCQVALTLETSTLDHEIPLARGGLDNANNWVLACGPCNDRRAAKMPELQEKDYDVSGKDETAGQEKADEQTQPGDAETPQKK